MKRIFFVLLISLSFPVVANAQNCASLTDPIEQLRCTKQKGSGGAYVAPQAAPQNKLLNCGVNVNCQSKNEVVQKMRSSWLRLRNSDGVAKAYADVCFDAFKTVQDLNPAITINAEIMQPQLNVCNVGLKELKQ
jgi:hypothetical protein